MLLLALAVVVVGGVLAAMNAAVLTNNVADRVFAADNVLLLLLLYPIAKALHEAGHAYAVKMGGGDVHEIGVMVLVFFPVPYVDASAAAGFPDRWRRVVVSAAGMLVELVVAGLASIAWTVLEPGPARAAAFDLMVLCGVSTLVFNGNPLLRFDGYYVLGDLIAIPNLDTRARKHVMALLRRYVLGMADQPSMVEVQGEGPWLVAFGVLSLSYRIVMTIGIGIIVATKLFVVGVVLALASVGQMLVLPVLRGLRYLGHDRALRGRRRRAWIGAGTLAIGLGVALFVIPVPHALIAPGVVWVPSQAIVRAGADGFVGAIAARPDSDVAVGALLFRLVDPVAAAQTDVLGAEVAVEQSRFDSVNQIDLVQGRLFADQLARARATYDRARERIDGLDVVAPHAGRFIVPNAAILPGRFVHKGDVIGYVLGGDDIRVHVVVSQADLDLARAGTRSVGVLLAEGMDRVLAARIVRSTPSALERAPAPALSPEGGGPMLVDPKSPGHDRPLDRWYAFEIALTDMPAGAPAAMVSRIGEHAAARFDLGGQPLGWRLALWARQAVLRTLDL